MPGPKTNVAAATAEISKGNYIYRIKLKRNDELGHLAKAFNHMNAELLRKDLIETVQLVKLYISSGTAGRRGQGQKS